MYLSFLPECFLYQRVLSDRLMIYKQDCESLSQRVDTPVNVIQTLHQIRLQHPYVVNIILAGLTELSSYMRITNEDRPHIIRILKYLLIINYNLKITCLVRLISTCSKIIDNSFTEIIESFN